jgi:hypothetical protein
MWRLSDISRLITSVCISVPVFKKPGFFSLCNGSLSVLIEAKVRNHHDLVVNKGTAYKKNEAD